jgi:hypothetical protein
MAEQNLKDLSQDKLKKRKRLGIAVLCLLLGAAILEIIIILVDFINKKQPDFRLLGGAAACLVVALPIYLGIKKINEEISRRKSQ